MKMAYTMGELYFLPTAHCNHARTHGVLSVEERVGRPYMSSKQGLRQELVMLSCRVVKQIVYSFRKYAIPREPLHFPESHAQAVRFSCPRFATISACRLKHRHTQSHQPRGVDSDVTLGVVLVAGTTGWAAISNGRKTDTTM